MSLGIRFSVFSSNRVQGSGREVFREVLGARAMVDVLEVRRLLSAAVQASVQSFEGTAGAIEASLDAGADIAERAGGPEFAKGDGSAVQLGGVNGPTTFSAARIDDGSGRDNLHGSGAVLEWVEPMESDEASSLLIAPADVNVAGRFSTARVLTGNMSPVASMTVACGNVFAA
jgi:hypothetical protein